MNSNSQGATNPTAYWHPESILQFGRVTYNPALSLAGKALGNFLVKRFADDESICIIVPGIGPGFTDLPLLLGIGEQLALHKKQLVVVGLDRSLPSLSFVEKVVESAELWQDLKHGNFLRVAEMVLPDIDDSHEKSKSGLLDGIHHAQHLPFDLALVLHDFNPADTNNPLDSLEDLLKSCFKFNNKIAQMVICPHAIVSHTFFHHLKNWREVFVNFLSLLRPSGLLVNIHVIGDFDAAEGRFDRCKNDNPFLHFFRRYWALRDSNANSTYRVKDLSAIDVRNLFRMIELCGLIVNKKQTENINKLLKRNSLEHVWANNGLIDLLQKKTFRTFDEGIEPEQHEALVERLRGEFAESADSVTRLCHSITVAEHLLTDSDQLESREKHLFFASWDRNHYRRLVEKIFTNAKQGIPREMWSELYNDVITFEGDEYADPDIANALRQELVSDKKTPGIRKIESDREREFGSEEILRLWNEERRVVNSRLLYARDVLNDIDFDVFSRDTLKEAQEELGLLLLDTRALPDNLLAAYFMPYLNHLGNQGKWDDEHLVLQAGRYYPNEAKEIDDSIHNKYLKRISHLDFDITSFLFHDAIKELRKVFCVTYIRDLKNSMASSPGQVFLRYRIINDENLHFLEIIMPSTWNQDETDMVFHEDFPALLKERMIDKKASLMNVFATLGEVPHWNTIVSIPATVPLRKINQGAGIVQLFLKHGITAKWVRHLSLIFKRFYRTVSIWDWAEVTRRHARRAASAAILSRNMSHNISSHVIPRTRIENLDARAKKLWSEAENEREIDIEPQVWMAMVENTKTMLDDYIQRKSEFLAEVTTEPVLSGKRAFFYRDVLLPFLKNTALVDTIAANEGFRYDSHDKPSLTIRCFSETIAPENEISITYKRGATTLNTVPYAERLKINWQYAAQPLISNLEKDVQVALPGPVGEMAFYGILENVIRNSAKHGGFRINNEQLEIDIVLSDACDDSNDRYHLLIYDRRSVANQNTIRKLRKALEDDIILGEGQVRTSDWGCAELAICASLLGRFEEFSPDSKSISVMGSDELESDIITPCLVYRFSMLKAFSAILIGFETHNQSILEKAGYCQLPDLEALNALTKNGRGTSFGYSFAILKSDLIIFKEKEERRKLLSRLPFRVIVVGHKSEWPSFGKAYAFTDEKPPLDNPSKLQIWLWTTWLEQREWNADSSVSEVCISLQQNDKERPTNKLLEKAAIFNSNNEIADKSYRLQVIMYNETSQQDLQRKLPESKEGRFLIDRHAYIATNSSGICESQQVWSGLDKYNPDFDLLFNPDLHEPWTLPYQLIESARLRVLLIDERAAQRSMSNLERALGSALGLSSGVNPLYWHVARRVGVWIVTHIDIRFGQVDQTSMIDLVGAIRIKQDPDSSFQSHEGSPSLRLSADLTSDYGEFHLAEQLDIMTSNEVPLKIDTFDIVVIHQGLIDSITAKARIPAEQYLHKLRNYIPWIVVESGRGIPPEVHKSDEKFLPFSVIERALRGEYVGKLELAQRLMGLSRSRISWREMTD